MPAAARQKQRWAPQIIWAIPILAVLVGIFLAVQAFNERGPTITVSFKSGDGLEPGKTHVKFKDVNIGLVKDVTLDKDRQHVLATIELGKDAADFLLEDTRFWIVRPRVTATGVSGLGTLLAGPYIALDVGKSHKAKSHFVALEVAPIVTSDSAGREFILHAPNLGSHDVGAPVYFRRLPVGEVTAYELDKDGRGVTLKVFIYAPYDKYVTANSRFWNASGIDVSLSAAGLQVQTESLVSIMIGGIAFESPATDRVALSRSNTESPAETAATASSHFKLYSSRGEAMKTPDVQIEHFTILFKESVRGLSVGAPVEFRGVNIGEVVHVGTEFDQETLEFVQPVDIYFYPDRLRARSRNAAAALPPPKTEAERNRRLQRFVERGFRAQLQTGNLLTGQLYVGVDFFPEAPKVKFDRLCAIWGWKLEIWLVGNPFRVRPGLVEADHEMLIRRNPYLVGNGLFSPSHPTRHSRPGSEYAAHIQPSAGSQTLPQS